MCCCREAYTALKLCCWINTLEKRLFTAPYEAQDCAAKMEWFLPRFERVLQDPESAWGDWQQEYTRVSQRAAEHAPCVCSILIQWPSATSVLPAGLCLFCCVSAACMCSCAKGSFLVSFHVNALLKCLSGWRQEQYSHVLLLLLLHRLQMRPACCCKPHGS